MSLINLNGREFSKQDIQNNLIEEFLQSDFADAPLELSYICCFLKEWISEREYIEVNTSGSTGDPKAIRLSKKTMSNSARATLEYFSLKPASRVLLPLSASYIAGKMMIVRAIEGELDLYIIPPVSDPLRGVDREYDFVPLVPMQIESALVSGSIDNLRRIKKIIIGGAPVSSSLSKSLADYPTEAYTTYGMTETASHVAVSRLNKDGELEQYEALPGISFSTDDRGCLVISAPALCDDLLVTNDVVTLCDESHFKWKGRIDNVINSGGIKLHLETIESKIERFIGTPFFLVGEPDDRLGESMVLVIESPAYNEEEQNKLLNDISLCVRKYEVPKRIVYKKQLDRTASGKLKRRIN